MIFTPLAVYYVTTVGLDPLQLVLVGTTVEARSSCSRFRPASSPTSTRRLSIIVGQILFGIAYVFEGSVPLFGAIVLAEVIRGVGETFLSGASQAWLADEVGERRVTPLFLRAAQVRPAARLVGLGAGIGLATIQLSLPIVLGGALAIVLGLVLALIMPETGFRRSPNAVRDPLGAMTRIASTSVRHVRGSRCC
jgi:hypothetical protein